MLDIQHISKTFNVGTVNEKHAVTDLSLHLDKGDFVTVIGSNGAGKSTLFNAIAGSFYVDEGRILLNGKDITFTREHDRSRVIGRLFQGLRGTAPHMSIEEKTSPSRICARRTAIRSAASRPRTASFSAPSSRSSTWGWRTGWASPSVCSRAVSGRR